MNPSEKKKTTRHVYKTGAAGCGGKAAPTSAKNAGQVSYSIATFFIFCLRLFDGVTSVVFMLLSSFWRLGFILGFVRIFGIVNGNVQS
jgi:hypothetical protein